jgi:hypothetical protein
MKLASDTDRDWHLDKRVPIAMICALLGQTFVIGWWTSSIDSRVASLEKIDPSNQLTNIAVDIAGLKEKALSTNDDVSDIKRNIELLMQQVLQDKARR